MNENAIRGNSARGERATKRGRPYQWAVLLLLALLAVACGDTQQAILGGGAVEQAPIDEDGDGTIDGVPDAVNNIFTVDELNALRDAGLAIYTGEAPPTVDGRYIANSLYVEYDDQGATGAIAVYEYLLANQAEDGSLTLSYAAAGVDESAGNAAYVAGLDSCFAVFADAAGEDASGCSYRRATVISGCLDGTGSIAGFALGFVERENSGDCEAAMPEGAMRVIAESDGVAVSAL